MIQTPKEKAVCKLDTCETAQKTEHTEFTAEKKRVATLQAKFALLGHTFHQSSPNDGPGPVSYMAERWGLVRHLPTLDDADRFLIQISEAGHDRKHR